MPPRRRACTRERGAGSCWSFSYLRASLVGCYALPGTLFRHSVRSLISNFIPHSTSSSMVFNCQSSTTLVVLNAVVVVFVRFNLTFNITQGSHTCLISLTVISLERCTRLCALSTAAECLLFPTNHSQSQSHVLPSAV